MANYNGFQINSNYQTDLVVFSYSGSISLSSGYGTLSITHNLPFTPLAFGLYSTDGGTTWGDIDFQIQTGFGQMLSNSSTIEISINLYSSALPSVLVRVFAFAPSTASSVVVTPPTPLSNFYLDSRKTYELLIASGRTSVPNSNSFQTLYTHNLNYLPRVMVWEELPDGSIQRPYQWTNYFKPLLTTSSLGFYNYDDYYPQTKIIHWRIYGNQS